MALHPLEPVENLATGYRKTFEIGNRLLLLVVGEKGPAVTDAICPHAGGRLETGDVVGHRLRCPTHRYIFDLETGACAVGRREGWGPLKVYPVQSIDGVLWVDL